MPEEPMSEKPPAGGAEHPEMVVFHRARSPFEARIVVAVLEDAGIPAFVPGGLLTDEFAMSQRLMNVQSVEVHVPGDRLDEARDALAAAKASGEALEAEDRGAVSEPRNPTGEGGSRRAWIATVFLLVLMIPLVIAWLDGRATLKQLETAAPLHEFSRDGDRDVWRWRDGGALATVALDRDGNGIAEQTGFHARDGRLVQRSFDADQNGVTERIETIGAGGRIARVAEDADQDGRYERSIDMRADGLALHWIDADGDDFFERLELRRGEELLLVQEFRGAEGYQVLR
jgi:hypothetical protein